ncbi:FTR1-domain-containing protein [Hymenopellis radicata]|nr:FTR1-domain-containing protein [Hymenopellis radicata]
MEAVIFVGGVSLGQPATSIPLAAIVGIICGLIVGFLIYTFASRTTLTVFLIAMTNLLLLIGAGLFSRAVGAFERNSFNKLLGADVDDAGGSGPGSYRVQGNVWHLDCCDPENNLDSQDGAYSMLFSDGATMVLLEQSSRTYSTGSQSSLCLCTSSLKRDG